MKIYIPFAVAAVLVSGPGGVSAQAQSIKQMRYEATTTRKAMEDLRRTFPDKYDPAGELQKEFEDMTATLTALEKEGNSEKIAAFGKKFEDLRRQALLANPLLGFDKLLMVKRKNYADLKISNINRYWETMGLASNHECKTAIPNLTHWDNELAILSPVSSNGKLTTLYRPADSTYVGDMDLHWNADRLLYTATTSKNWVINQIDMNGQGVKRISQNPDEFSCYESIYLPGGKVMFNTTAMFTSVPCWHGLRDSGNLYTADADGGNMRQVCFDQDFDFHPVVLPSGQVLFVRWDYTGIIHVFLREWMVMNPDGTGQRAVWGSNSYFPNSLYTPKPLPGKTGQFVCVLTGYHDPPKSGLLVVVDLNKGYRNDDPIIAHISGRGKKLVPDIKDSYLNDQGADRFPIFNSPWPLSDKYFLVSAQTTAMGDMAIYLADIFDNLVPLAAVPGYHLMQPVPVVKREEPRVIPSKIDLTDKEGTVYIDNIYDGPGLKGYPHRIEEIRVIGYNFGYRNLAGPNLIGWGGPWEAMAIIGKTKVEEDGSAFFRVPANTPIAFHALDSLGQAVQLMRSWVTLMPGEVRSCVGCHESPAETAPVRHSIAARTIPKQMEAWYGPPRGFDFEREVQPVLDHYCISCHNGKNRNIPDLRSLENFPNYQGQRLDMHAVERSHEEYKARFGPMVPYTPAYEALVKYIRRVGVEDDAEMLTPGIYSAENSELFQLFRKGHHGVNLDARARDALITWIDLNAPCHGTWEDIMPVPEGSVEKRRKYQQLYGAPPYDFETIVSPEPFHFTTQNNPPNRTQQPEVSSAAFPLTEEQARRLQAAHGEVEKTVDLGDGITLTLVRIPAGEFIMGSDEGEADESPRTKITVKKAFWMGRTEVTNAQMRAFDPQHDSRYYGKRHETQEDKGATLNQLRQPAVRMSWDKAVAFCRWLSERTGMKFTLPTEAQWEYAARAGSDLPAQYGHAGDNFSGCANFADLCFAIGRSPAYRVYYGSHQTTGGITNMLLEGAELADRRYNDFGWVTAPVGNYRPNVWGLYDMQGNASEWTLSAYAPYPYDANDGRNDLGSGVVKVVRGGSYADRPARGTFSYRQFYPRWLTNEFIGFRVVAE